MCNWCAWWFNADGAVPAETVAATLADYGLRALGHQRQGGAARRRSAADAAIAQLRGVLELLEKERDTG